MVMTFQEFRKIKDSLPDGSMGRIADQLQMDEESVRNYFGGTHFENGKVQGVHFEKSVGGGLVQIEDKTVLEAALKIIKEQETAAHN